MVGTTGHKKSGHVAKPATAAVWYLHLNYGKGQLDTCIKAAGFPQQFAHLVYARYMDEHDFEGLPVNERNGCNYRQLHTLVVGGIVAHAASVNEPSMGKRSAVASQSASSDGFGHHGGGGEGGDCGGD